MGSRAFPLALLVRRGEGAFPLASLLCGWWGTFPLAPPCFSFLALTWALALALVRGLGAGSLQIDNKTERHIKYEIMTDLQGYHRGSKGNITHQ